MWPIFLLETHCLNNFCSLSWPPSIYVIDKVICNLVYKFSLNTILHLYTALEESLSRCTSMFDTKKHTNVWEKKFYRGHTDLNHGPIGLQPIALPLSYIPRHVEGNTRTPLFWMYKDVTSPWVLVGPPFFPSPIPANRPHPSVFIGTSVTNMFSGVKRFSWCSGYHICLTHRRSPVRSRAKTYYSHVV